VVFGEVLCDLFAPEAGQSLAHTPHLVPRLGGAPANVAVQLALLDVPTRLVTAVGRDPFGLRLRQQLSLHGVDTSAVKEDGQRRTGCTLVEVDHSGERRFFGFREKSADLALGPADVEVAAVRRALERAGVVHTGTVSLRAPSSRQATARLHRRARAAGAIVSVDVNLRPGMFPSLPLLLRLANGAAGAADVVKATRDEAIQLRGRKGADDALADFLLDKGPRLVLLTFGEEGALLATRRRRVRVDPVVVDRAVDVTGAGDAFVGAVLAWLLRQGVAPDDLDDLDDDGLASAGREAAACGAAVVTALGATTNMHSLALLRGQVGKDR
jgi:fructokinase